MNESDELRDRAIYAHWVLKSAIAGDVKLGIEDLKDIAHTLEMLSFLHEGAADVVVYGGDASLPEFVDVEQAARILGIHPESVRRLYRDKKLPGFKVGNKILFHESVLSVFSSLYDNRRGNLSWRYGDGSILGPMGVV